MANEFEANKNEPGKANQPQIAPIPDAQNPDTNSPDVMERNQNSPTGVQRDDTAGSPVPNAERNNTDPRIQAILNQGRTVPATATSPVGGRAITPTEGTTVKREGEMPSFPNTPSADEVSHRRSPEVEGIRGGMMVRVKPLNGDEEVVGKVLGISADTKMGEILFIDERNETRRAFFKAEDADVLFEPPSIETGIRTFINDDQTYDGRELRMERPRNEKAPVEKQETLRKRTMESNIAITKEL